MSDDRSGSSRPRPSYGLPGPSSTPSAPGSSRPVYGLPGQTPSAPAPDGWEHGAQAPPVHPAGPSTTGSDPWSGPALAGVAGLGEPGSPSSPPPWGAAPTGPTPMPSRGRRGLVQLLVGIACFLLGGIALVVGVVMAFGSVVGAVTDGPQAFGGPSGSIDAAGGHMYLVLVPEAQADAATCTADATDDSVVDVTPASGTVDFADGSGTYRQMLGVWAHEDTTITITCEGADASYVGPVSPTRLLLPLAIGVIGGLLLGVLGLILVIVGIVRLRRSSRMR